MTGLTIKVVGIPAPQGSKTGFTNKYTGRVVLVESSKKAKPWRHDVKAAALEARQAVGHETFTGPVTVEMQFYFEHPKAHYRTGRLANLLRPNAPFWKSTIPDLSKLVRACEDALTDAGVWRDDALVVEMTVAKAYSDPAERPGVHITVLPIADNTAVSHPPREAARQETLL